ncbi:MAG: ribonuclease P protein component [Opitutales bacterium]|nr:ribonuclease P protein component [Opitutales bacterium]
MRFSASHKIRKASDFAHLRAKGSRFNCGSFVLIGAERSADEKMLPFPRFAVIASKKLVGNHAVDRNRAKRIFREIFRRNRNSLSATWDFLLIARRSSLAVPFEKLSEQFAAGARFLCTSQQS